jgi:hypothetical protein
LYEGRKASCFVSGTVTTVPITFPFIEVHSLQNSGYFPTKAASFSTYFFHVFVKQYAGRVKLLVERSRSSSRAPCFSSSWAAKRLEFILQAPKKRKVGGWQIRPGEVETSAGEVETFGEVETSEGKIVASIFWDGEWILLGEFFERDAVMNCEQTLNKLQQRVRKVRP